MIENVRTDQDDSVRIVTLDRPERKNALTAAMLSGLVGLFREIAADPDTRVVVLRGEGTDFSSGLDLGEMEAARAKAGTVALTEIEDLFRAVDALPQPTIAAVRGVAIAGGCELSLHCDLRLVSPDARFAMPLTKLGLTLPFPLIQKLVEHLGTAHAAEILYTGDFVPAERALALRMVNRIVPAERLDDEALELARRIAANAPLSVRAMKRAIARSRKPAQGIDWSDLAAEQREIAKSRDVVEGVRAMREKRPPRFEGR